MLSMREIAEIAAKVAAKNLNGWEDASDVELKSEDLPNGCARAWWEPRKRS